MTLATLPKSHLEKPNSEAAEQVALAFLAGYQCENTRGAYGRDLRDWFGWCLAHSLAVLQARRLHVDLYARELEEAAGRSPATVARKLSTLSAFYTYALQEEILDRSPMQHVKRPRVSDESPLHSLDQAEAQAFLEAAKAAGSRDHALACLLLLNGLRASETASADVSDLASEQGHHTLVTVRKGGKKQRHGLPPRTAAAIEKYLEGRSDGPLLLDNKGERIDRHGIARIVRRLARSAGIVNPITPHSMRASFITLNRIAGVPLEDVQDAAGHADPRTTRRYDRARNNLDRSPSYTLAAFLSEQRGPKPGNGHHGNT